MCHWGHPKGCARRPCVEGNGSHLLLLLNRDGNRARLSSSLGFSQAHRVLTTLFRSIPQTHCEENTFYWIETVRNKTALTPCVALTRATTLILVRRNSCLATAAPLTRGVQLYVCSLVEWYHHTKERQGSFQGRKHASFISTCPPPNPGNIY